MSIVQIRDSLQYEDVVIPVADRYIIFEKRIELQDGNRHTLLNVDFMDDGFIKLISQVVGADVCFEFYLSPMPISAGAGTVGGIYLNGGPLASDDAVLYKEIALSVGNFTGEQHMPNDFLGSTPTFSWYSPTLYATLIVHGAVTQTADILLPAISMSYLATIKEQNVSSVEYGIGMIQEYRYAQTKLLMNNGYLVNTALSSGRHFPSWKFGGIRPEFMMKANSDLGFFLSGYQDNTAERMVTNARIQDTLAEAKTMVAYDAPFGSLSLVAPGGYVPDWIRFLDFQNEIMFGAQRAEFPPMLKNTDGTTQMN